MGVDVVERTHCGADRGVQSSGCGLVGREQPLDGAAQLRVAAAFPIEKRASQRFVELEGPVAHRAPYAASPTSYGQCQVVRESMSDRSLSMRPRRAWLKMRWDSRTSPSKSRRNATALHSRTAA